MRILFLYPNLGTQLGVNLGLASLSASLKAAGHETRLVNLSEQLPPIPSDDEVVAEVREGGAQMVAFSCLSMQYAEALRLARMLRERGTGAGEAEPVFVVGGVHPTMVPEEVMGDGVWDHVGVGECEDALVALVASLERGERRDDYPNFLSRKIDGEGWRANPVGPLPDLAKLPAPDYELFDTQRILELKDGWFSIMTSRGCPFRCTYCLNHRVVERYAHDLEVSVAKVGYSRTRPMEAMIEEIRDVLTRYDGIKTFILDDDLFTHHTEHARAFARAYRDAGFDVPWVANSHVRRLDPTLAGELAAGGCKILKLGIESGSPRVRREVLRRLMSNEDILATIAAAEGAGLHTSGFVMLGLPGESLAERDATVEFLAQSGIGRFRTSLFFPFPGTESFDQALAHGYVPPEDAKGSTDFTAQSDLDFGARENLRIEKISACMPWFVNARLDAYREGTAAARYRAVIGEVLALDRDGWEAFREGVRARDEELSTAAVRAGEVHYAIRYHPFMGVRSDWFLAEERAEERGETGI